MRKLSVLMILICSVTAAQQVPVLDNATAAALAEKPLHCISQEYPNKTAHVINGAADAVMSPRELHPSFYGCFDWHSSVHGHWMLVRLLKTHPGLEKAEEIFELLSHSFSPEKIKAEAAYFTRFQIAQNFERTYGWAWLLKLDEELVTWNHPQAKIWHRNLKPLTDEILRLWKNYLPNQTYPNRTGVHPNSAFALAFALDWARAVGDKAFEKQLSDIARTFYLNDRKTPAYLEPDGSDFFSPSLQIADLMRRVLPQAEFQKWLTRFYTRQSLDNLDLMPVISDINDYQTVHLVGLSLTRAWCMKGVAAALPANHKLRKRFTASADRFLAHALPLVFQGNYGGDHWLASFAVYALSDGE